MAERRMFAKTIVDSDAFLDMPLSTQCLYFHLNMRADDDGFINSPKKIQRIIGSSDDDLKILVSKKFIIPFESGVVVIKHWKIHNYIRNDRYKETMYVDEKSQLLEKENKAYTLGIPNDNQMDTQDRLGKDRLGKDRLGKDRLGKDRLGKDRLEYIIVIYNDFCTNLPKAEKLTEKRKTNINKFLKEFSDDDFKKICLLANSNSFLTGNNDRGWKADIDFLLRTDKATKILEGQYSSKGGMNDFKLLYEEAKKEDEQNGNN